MSFFLNYSADKAEYMLTTAGYIAVILLLAVVFLGFQFFSKPNQTTPHIRTQRLVYCAGAMALSLVTSLIKFASLPFGGSITLFSMLFICLIGYVFGVRTGIMTGVAYGILQFIMNPYIFAPIQVLLDYPLAFGALGLSGLFRNKKHGLIAGYITGVIGRYLFHVISGYIFFASYAPEGTNSMIYILVYNATYILPELIVTIIVLYMPPVLKAITQVKRQAVSE
ncbi:energy-coupled thiamine transporter ThiT [Lacrimispora algidixylanolytica]|uniref:Energy-coupled thiamine transporter ThiT n=1 Tax=Lacrimispora algidixylanolytica TaxID=94868 RepID=A0A419T749_9FIRM|nr:energy-coupled thiamine transporter ThiT [Lacrimispora algidixylanolytica]RKD33249.1 energy-coupled thiamine transporter ThiT [Lacrimispora algidixylanolytica]